jgi:hypothetical protein
MAGCVLHLTDWIHLFALAAASRPAYGLSQPLGSFSLGVKRPEREDDHSFSGWVELHISYPHVFMSCSLGPRTTLFCIKLPHKSRFPRLSVSAKSNEPIYVFLFGLHATQYAHLILLQQYDKYENTDFNIAPTSTIRKTQTRSWCNSLFTRSR